MSFISFCTLIFRKYPDIDGYQLLKMCEVAYQEIQEEESN